MEKNWQVIKVTTHGQVTAVRNHRHPRIAYLHALMLDALALAQSNGAKIRWHADVRRNPATDRRG